jgi:hypothetical protein
VGGQRDVGKEVYEREDVDDGVDVSGDGGADLNVSVSVGNRVNTSLEVDERVNVDIGACGRRAWIWMWA